MLKDNQLASPYLIRQVCITGIAYASSPVTTWLWTVDNPANHWTIYSPNQSNTLVAVTGGGGISVSASNGCGTSRDGVTIFSNCHRFAIAAAPNPTADNVTVTIIQQNIAAPGAKDEELIYQLNVADQLGNIKKKFKYTSGVSSVKISLKDLVRGGYTLQAFNGTYWESAKVIKQ